MDSPRSSFSRPSSQKSFRPAISAFRRITSEKNFSQSSLPSFMRISMSDPFRHIPQIPPRQSEPKKLSDILLRIRGRNLSRQDLMSLKPQYLLTPNMVDSCLSLIKQLNSRLLLEQKVFDRVLIASTDLSTYILSKNSRAHSKSNILKYEQVLDSYLLLPVYQQYWELFVVNFRERIVKVFDPCKQRIRLDERLSSLFEFLQHQIRYHYKTEIQSTIWADFMFLENEEIQVFKPQDSGVYVLKHAENIARENRQGVKPSDFEKYRSEYLQLLFKYSQRVAMI